MKKLNRKGFTLIELLAVVVILAIIVVVTVPTILSSIDDARYSTIHSLSKEVATWYDNGVVSDEMAFGSDYVSILNGATATNDWQCLGSVMGTATGKTDKSLADMYGLTTTDLVLTGTAPTSTTPTKGTCSAIKIVDGHAEVILIGADSGKFKDKGSYSESANGVKLEKQQQNNNNQENS